MVEDKNNKIFTELTEHIKSLYPKLNTGSNYNEKVKLPFMHFYQFDGTTALVDLSNNEVGVNLAFQIDVYNDTGMNLARKISDDIRLYMIQNGFRCRTFMPMYSSSNVSRFVARYARLDV